MSPTREHWGAGHVAHGRMADRQAIDIQSSRHEPCQSWAAAYRAQGIDLTAHIHTGSSSLQANKSSRSELRPAVNCLIKYFGSQPWPFPHSLMIGFTASYAGGEISLDDDEIENAGWFAVDNLPRIPGKISIARKLIDWFIEKQGKGPYNTREG